VAGGLRRLALVRRGVRTSGRGAISEDSEGSGFGPALLLLMRRRLRRPAGRTCSATTYLAMAGTGRMPVPRVRAGFIWKVSGVQRSGVVVDQVAEQIRVGVPIPTSIDATLVKSA
jgi:hypothetical protein